ncbi:MAG: hypothetical protein HY828_00425 [Actinobacteria bacterium]|nr:hypothetical protein [Actinomycetota bacterium]
MIARWRSARSPRRADLQPEAGRDEGMAMVMCMVFIIIGMMVISPLLGYAATVLHSSRTQTLKTDRAEAARGALRLAMADPKALYDTCSPSGLTTSVTLLKSSELDVPITTKCTTVKSAAELNDTDLRIAMTLTQVGAVAPVGTVGSVYAGSGQADTLAWSAGATTASTGGQVWLPQLAAHALNHPANAGYMMPAWAGSCRVFFPGTYNAAVTINDSVPTFFTSGIYYFEDAVTFGSDAAVVIGEGATEGCTDDQDAAYNAINAPLNHNISGLGATFVFGKTGRLVVTDTGAAGAGPSVVFNSRLVDPTDVGSAASKNVSIISVNGVYSSPSTNLDLDLPGQLHVPKSMLLAGATPVDAATGEYVPSTLVPTVLPALPENPIIDIQFAAGSGGKVFVPGYISVPQGRINIAVAPGMGANKSVELVGGVLAATFTQTVDQPAITSLGMINRIVQKTFKLVATTDQSTPRVSSVAVVQINDYGEFAINSWVTESSGSTP